MSLQAPAKIVLVGAKHVGKSTVGSALAQKINVPFFDGDILTYNKAQVEYTKHAFSNIRDVYVHLGKEAFHTLECVAISELKEQKYVLAAGGGVLESPLVWKLFKDVYIVLLDVPYEVVWNRIAELALQSGLPAFLQDEKDPQQAFKCIFEARQAIYKNHAHFVCESGGKDVSEIIDSISHALQMN